MLTTAMTWVKIAKYFTCDCNVSVEDQHHTVNRSASVASSDSQLCSGIVNSFLIGEKNGVGYAAGVKGTLVKIPVPGTNKTLSMCKMKVYGILGMTMYCVNKFHFL